MIFKKIYDLLSHRSEVNYLYFSILFVTLSFFSLSHILFWEQPLWGIRLFFFLYCLGQALLETWAFIFIGYFLKRFTKKWLFFSFIALSFIALLIHFTDFTMIRLMDTSISYVCKFLFGQGISHLWIAFQALNMNWKMGLMILMALLLIPGIGIFLYWTTNHLSKKKPWSIAHGHIGIALLITAASLLVLEVLAHPYLDRMIYDRLQKTVPLGTTFLSPSQKIIALEKPIFKNDAEKPISYSSQAIQKPNIYLFVIETLRKDFVTQETAPHLTEFGKQHLSVKDSFANSNWTPLSWYAIFHSHLPFEWSLLKNHPDQGSYPLSWLKEIGYEIHTFTSADLAYFGMDQLLFGKNKKLLTSLQDYSSYRNLTPCQRDLCCLKAFQKIIAQKKFQEGQLFIFFLDGTHSEYSFPNHPSPKFQPISEQIDYLTITAKEIEPIKNRYRNAIFAIDTLLGAFFSTLHQEKLYKESVILITGDHGEEFYEEGALFHGTHLNRYQTEVPIVCKFGEEKIEAKKATHIDLMPSLLHHITKKEPPFLEGKSLLNPTDSKDYRIAVLQNGPDTPIEFAIEMGNERVQLRFANTKAIEQQKVLEIISFQIDGYNEEENISDEMKKRFHHAIKDLQERSLTSAP